MRELDLHQWLAELAETLVQGTLSAELGIQEGVVMTTGKLPYRRLDCDGRALAYIRVRPKKRVVRIDVSGLWKAPGRSRLKVQAAGGSATLMVRSEADLHDAIRFLVNTVSKTRGRSEPRSVAFDPTLSPM